MANEKEQVAESQESQERPTPEFSGEKQTSPSNQADELAERVLEKLEPKMQEIAEKQWQSGKDRRIAEHETRLDSLEGALAEYDRLLESGMSSAEAKDKMSLNMTLKELREEVKELKQQDGQETSGRSDTDWTSQEQAILDRVGMEANSPEFAEFVRSKTWESEQEYLDALSKKAFEWRTASASKPSPSPSTVANTGGRSAPTGDATEKYKKDMLAARGNAAEIRRIKKEAREAGVDVDNIGFK